MGFDRNAASDQAFGHKPVLLEECLTALNIKPDGIYVDGTLGRAGHSLEIVKNSPEMAALSAWIGTKRPLRPPKFAWPTIWTG